MAGCMWYVGGDACGGGDSRDGVAVLVQQQGGARRAAGQVAAQQGGHAVTQRARPALRLTDHLHEALQDAVDLLAVNYTLLQSR